jgi:hypothetical protein
MGLFDGMDYNGNGKRDIFDASVDYQNIKRLTSTQTSEQNSKSTSDKGNSKRIWNEENTIRTHNEEKSTRTHSEEISQGTYNEENNSIGYIKMNGKIVYDPSEDSNGIIILKCFLVTTLCICGCVLPFIYNMNFIVKFISIFGGLGLSLLVFKLKF